MKRWLPWLLVPFVFTVWAAATPNTSQKMLADTDTSVLLTAIRERQDPLSWFAGDWPLGNHFYRPVSTLTFEFDNWRGGNDAVPYGQTNALLAAVCIGLLFWLVRECTDNPGTAAGATLLFGLLHVWPELVSFAGGASWILAALVWLGLLRGGTGKLVPTLLCSLGFVFWAGSMTSVSDFQSRVVDWLPGRTASVMTVFCLASLASYCRYIRLTSARPEVPASALDPAVTNSTLPAQPGKAPWLWLVPAYLGAALALGSYEQAVMLPGVATAYLVLEKVMGRRPRWLSVVGYWVLLAAYLALRKAVIPQDVSGYQAQQFRFGPGVFLSLADFGLWGLRSALEVAPIVSSGIAFIVLPSFYAAVTSILANISAFFSVARSPARWQLVAAAAIALLSFLPMAWLKYFGHYLYWPGAMWAVFVAMYGSVVWKLFATAVSLPAIQAPTRQNPAPGSLPRP